MTPGLLYISNRCLLFTCTHIAHALCIQFLFLFLFFKNKIKNKKSLSLCVFVFYHFQLC
jgi:hypothetical protein